RAASSNPTDVLICHEIAEQLDDAVLKLSPIDRKALLLRYFEDRAINDIATELNVTEAAAKQRLSRAVAKLRNRLAHRAGAMMTTIDLATLAALLESHAVRMAPAGLSSAALAAATGHRAGADLFAAADATADENPAGVKSTALAAVPDQRMALWPVALEALPTCCAPEAPLTTEPPKPAGFRSM